MFILRCTRKLLGRLPARSGGDGDDGASDTRLGDWTAHLFFIGRQQIVLGVNNKTLLPVLLPIAPIKTFTSRFVEAAGEMLMALGIDRKAVLAEMGAMSECVVAPTNDRRVLGTINDFGRMLEVYLDGRPVVEVALHLAEAPCGPLKMGRPRDAARELFAQRWIGSNKPNLRLVKG
jgi:hypothetical protein